MWIMLINFQSRTGFTSGILSLLSIYQSICKLRAVAQLVEP